MRRSHRLFHAGLLSPAIFLVASVLLLLATLLRGGNRAVALWGLEGLGLLLLVLLYRQQSGGAIQPDHTESEVMPLRKAERCLLLVPLIGALIYLLPIPSFLWAMLPSRAGYLTGMEAVGRSGSAWIPLSLVPDASWHSLLASIPLLAAFCVARLVSSDRLLVLLKLLIGVAVFQSMMGLMQVTRLGGLYFGAEFAGSAIGTFANSNHLSNFITMLLPLGYLLLWRSAMSRSRGHYRLKFRPEALFWMTAVFLMWIGLLVSGSRMGVLSAIVVTAICVYVAQTQFHSLHRKLIVVVAGVAILLLMSLVGMKGFMARVSQPGTFMSDAGLRTSLMDSSLSLLAQQFPLGSGPGTFGDVYPAVQPADIMLTVNHAHNDYLEFLVEWGALGVAFLGLLLWLAFIQTRCLVRKAHEQPCPQPQDLKIQLACAIGLLAILMHGFVDFNFRIPANAMLAAFLFGVYMRLDGALGKRA